MSFQDIRTEEGFQAHLKETMRRWARDDQSWVEEDRHSLGWHIFGSGLAVMNDALYLGPNFYGHPRHRREIDPTVSDDHIVPYLIEVHRWYTDPARRRY